MTEYIIAMSAGPTYGATLPDATVETITFGRPTGSARIPGVMIAVPPDPPMPMMPPIAASLARTNASNATAIAPTASPRSDEATAAPPSG